MHALHPRNDTRSARTLGPIMNQPKPLEPERLTWAVLLARWTEFARSAVALPKEGEAGLVRQSVADIITLQAVWFALGDRKSVV